MPLDLQLMTGLIQREVISTCLWKLIHLTLLTAVKNSYRSGTCLKISLIVK